ncbi:MAG: chemotaxis protein CheA [SAR324 cluster bacterium]|nr:chemotaxis protein CheA [SAR324 cluster bacterium]
METIVFTDVLSEIEPFREELEAALLNKDLRKCKLPDLNAIMQPMDGSLAIYQKHELTDYILGIEFINELLGSIAIEQIGHHAGLSYVLNTYEIIDEYLVKSAAGEELSPTLGENIVKIKEMFAGVTKAINKTTDTPEEVMQDAPSGEVLEDGTISDFINEVNEGLESVEESVLDLEADITREDLINLVFRVMHTIKGTSGFLGMPTIGKIAHRTEDILGEVRDKKRILGPDVFNLLFKSIDTLKNLIEQITTMVEGGSPAAVNVGDFYRVLDICIDGEAVSAPPIAAIASEPLTKETEVAAAPEVTKTATETQKQKGSEPAKTGKIQEMLKVPAEKLDELSGLVGEMVVALSLLTQNPIINEIGERKVTSQLDHLDKITESLRDKVLGIRMFPISTVFSKLSRQVRDLSVKSGKQINLNLEGADTLVDKSIIDNIYAPLMHLVRNSIDHGIEPPDERGSKDKTGNVTITAQHLGDSISLSIADDGKGLDADKLLDKAIEKGLAKPDKDYTDKEIFNFIFMPGFSTAKKITDISGRGVGMDVVKKSVEQLRGKITTESEKGIGTTLILKLPLTTSIIEGLVVSLEQSRFIFPILDVNQTITPESGDLKGFQGKSNEFLLLQGESVPIVKLYELYELEPKITDPSKSVIIVVNVGTKKYGIMVDDLLHRQQIVIQNLGERFSHVKGISGGTILGDGRVGLILDPVSLIHELYSKKEEQA